MIGLSFVSDLPIATNASACIYLSHLGFVLLLLKMALQTIGSLFKRPLSSSF